MKTIPAPLLVNTTDRLATTLTFAVLLHGVVILGVGFSGEDGSTDNTTVEVTLVQGNTDTAPQDADYLANANQIGEGNTTEHVRPETPRAGLPQLPSPRNQEAARAETATTPITTIADAQYHALRKNERRPPLQMRLLHAGNLPTDPFSAEGDTAQAYNETPREKFIAVNTRASGYAEYIEGWRRKVERLGNLNYPDAARREGLSGTVRIEVALNADGGIRQVRVRVPSRYRELDEAALRIIRLASPFAPFPPQIRRDTDVLRFAFDWQFTDGRPGGGRVGLPAG